MIVLLTNVADPSPSAQVDVAPSTGGVDPNIWGIKKNKEPSGALCRNTVYHDPELLWGEKARIVRGEHLLGKLNHRQSHSGEAASPPRPR